MPANVSLALVGCGWISEYHVEGYRDLWLHGCRDFTVTAVCDRDIDAARLRAGQIAAYQGTVPAIFTDVDALAVSPVADAADVCVPHAFHHTVAIALLEGGKHVLLEKPLGITIRASRLIIAAAARAERVLATAENIRRDLSARACAWAVNTAGLIGEPIAGSVKTFFNGKLDLDDPKFRWRADKRLTGGGMLMDSGAHFADMMLVLFGEVDRVSCHMRCLDHRDIGELPGVGKGRVDVESYWHADIRFVSGMQVAWSFSNVFLGPKEDAGSYNGTAGCIIDQGGPLHPFAGGGTIHTADGKTLEQAQISDLYLAQLGEAERSRLFPYGLTNGFPIEIWDFVDAIVRGRPPEMDGRAGLRAKTLCECCYESATIGRPVTFKEVLDGAVDAYQRPIDDQWKLRESVANAR